MASSLAVETPSPAPQIPVVDVVSPPQVAASADAKDALTSFTASFADEIVKAAQEKVIAHIRKFTTSLVELPEMKGVTQKELLDLWNSTNAIQVTEGSGTKAPSRPRAQTDAAKPCTQIMSRGERKQQACGKASVVGSEPCLCPEHHRKANPEPVTDAAPVVAKPAAGSVCPHILTTGTNKGNPCGKPSKIGPYCGVHAKSH